MGFELLLNQMFVPAVAITAVGASVGIFIQQKYFKNAILGERSQFFIMAEVEEKSDDQASQDLYKDVVQDISAQGPPVAADTNAIIQKIRQYECKLSGVKEQKSTNCKIIKFQHNTSKKYNLMSDITTSEQPLPEDQTVEVNQQNEIKKSDLKQKDTYVLVQVPESTISELTWKDNQKIEVKPADEGYKIFGTLKPLFVVEGNGFYGRTKNAFVIPVDFHDPSVESTNNQTTTISISPNEYKCAFKEKPEQNDLKKCTIKKSISSSQYSAPVEDASSIERGEIYLVTLDEEDDMKQLSNYSFFYIQTDSSEQVLANPKKVTFNSPIPAILNEKPGNEHAFIMANAIY